MKMKPYRCTDGSETKNIRAKSAQEAASKYALASCTVTVREIKIGKDAEEKPVGGEERIKVEIADTATKYTAGDTFALAIGDTLPAGAKFDRWVLTNGQEEPSNFIDIVEGYHHEDYFRSGRYLGADEAGVEPQFVAGNE